MAFDCTFPCIRSDVATRLTQDMLAARAHDFGLAHAYDVVSIDILPHRWRRGLVDVVVHMAYGDDVLEPQFPDEAKAAVESAVAALLRERLALAPER